ncbi:unnamed protein product [Schistosoma margrebowiei]|uniref:Uncharacterized protein n=1 Tax=Schistosoma margrebowiei TaxID=48269 RepID=A0A183MH39_9TREM|nr:unnamed protein product [Schistosoma margrebowiei]
MLLYSRHEEENTPHTQGTALMLSKQAQNALIGWESHGPRIIRASFKTKKEGISMNEGIKEVITSTCYEVLGRKKHHHREWATVDTLDSRKKAAFNTSRTRVEKAKAQAEYTEVNKEM